MDKFITSPTLRFNYKVSVKDQCCSSLVLNDLMKSLEGFKKLIVTHAPNPLSTHTTKHHTMHADHQYYVGDAVTRPR